MTDTPQSGVLEALTDIAAALRCQDTDAARAAANSLHNQLRAGFAASKEQN